MRAEPGWEKLAADQRQALTVIADKIARMLNGDPNYRDNWHDILGYAKLVDDRMAASEQAVEVVVSDLLGEPGLGNPFQVREGFTRVTNGCPLPPPPGMSRLVDLQMVTGEVVNTVWDDARHNEDWAQVVAYKLHAVQIHD